MFATRLVQSGVDLYKVQRLLGHKSPMMAQRYATQGGATYSPAAWGLGGWSTSSANENVHGFDAPYSYVSLPVYLQR